MPLVPVVFPKLEPSYQPLDNAARACLDHFGRTGHAPYFEAACAPNGGHCPTSGQLEAAIRRAAAARSPAPSLRGLRVELKSVNPLRGTVHIVTGVG